MDTIIVAGIGTGVGKTVACAILATLLEADYWKPIQCGDEKTSDTALMQQWLDPEQHTIHQPAYSLQAPLSPHHAARLENETIDCNSIALPHTQRPLVIEGVGGILVPLTLDRTSLDLLTSWSHRWIIVARQYLGSINHTLMTLEILQKRAISPLGIIFNGEINLDSEAAILQISQVPFLARVLPEENLNKQTIQRYAHKWKPHLVQHLL